MKKKIKPRAEVELRLLKSTKSKKLYYALYEKEEIVKMWSAADISSAGIDLISELVKAFDLGYDVRFQFPKTEKDGSKRLIPREIRLYNEPEEQKGEENGYS